LFKKILKEKGYLPSPYRKAEGLADEVSLFLYPAAVWQSAYTFKGAFRSVTLALGLFYSKISKLDKNSSCQGKL